MIKVLNEGKDIIHYNIVCKNCQSLLEYTDYDVKRIDRRYHPFKPIKFKGKKSYSPVYSRNVIYFSCPVCHEEVVINDGKDSENIVGWDEIIERKIK